MQWLIDIIKDWVITQAYATEAWVLAKGYATIIYVVEQITLLQAWVLAKGYLPKSDFPAYGMPVNVTGDPSPDCTSTYFRAGDYNGKPYYNRIDGSFFLWWDDIANWYITDLLGLLPPGGWIRNDPSHIGLYTPLGVYHNNLTVADGHKYLSQGFVNRGDPAAADWTQANLIEDGAWHVLDCSAIVPSDVKGILFSLWLQNTSIYKRFYIRRHGNIHPYADAKQATQVAGIYIFEDLVCPCDADRKIDYWINAGGWLSIRFTVKGWWF